MAQVYSRLFARGTQAGGVLANLLTVPVGRVYVVRDMVLTPLDPPPVIYQAKVSGVTFDAQYSVAQYVPRGWQGMQVLNAGDVLTLGTGGVLGWEYMVSGFDLGA